MQTKYETPEGAEFTNADMRDLAAIAARADDVVFHELWRLPPMYNNEAYVKRILPFGSMAFPSQNPGPNDGTVHAPGFNNGSVRVAPFRAIVGARARTNEAGGWDTGYASIRSAMWMPSGGNSAAGQYVQIAPTTSNHRWTLICARMNVDANSANVTRYIKDTAGVQGTVNAPNKRVTTVSLEVINGTESSTPVRPNPPDDTDDVIYIPLAYVVVAHPWTATSTVLNRQIHQCAQTALISRTMGAVSAMPANMLFNHRQRDNTASPFFTQNDFDQTHRPSFHLPPEMAGVEERWFGLTFLTQSVGGSGITTFFLPLNSNTVIDDSVDWRQRNFKCEVSVRAGLPNTGVAWEGDTPTEFAVPSSRAPAFFQFMGQSFRDDGFGAGVTPGCKGLIARFDNTNFAPMPAGGHVYIYVHQNTGNLMARVSQVNPQATFFFWIRATGPYAATPQFPTT